MAAHNAERYLAEAIESVLSQDHASFELLVGDDVSTDRTREVLARYRSDPRVRTRFGRTHRFAAGTRNRLFRMARGEYILICDADDRLAPGALRALSDVLDRHPSVGVAHGEVCEMGSSRLLTTWTGDPRTSAMAVFCGLFRPPPHGGSLIRRELVQRLGGYDERFRISEDFDLMVRLAETSKVVCLSGRVCYLWRRHPASQTSRDDGWQRATQQIVAEALDRRSHSVVRP